MTRVKYILYLVLMISNFSFSQTNLVSNPGFENNSSCPTFMLQWDKCIGWDNCNGNVGGGLWGTPDYYHTCGVSQSPYNPVPPNTGMGFCNPHTGNAMMGLVGYNASYADYREYISTQLICPLTAGNTYSVSFWITASSAPEVQYNSSHFGVLLSNTAPVQSNYLVINATPQYEIATITNNIAWQKHTFTISPTSTLNYITLGCFKSEPFLTTSLTTPSASQPYSNYFIDDIEVLNLSSSGSFSTTSSISNIKCNGLANGSASVTASGSGPYSYLWTPGGFTTSAVSNLNAGNYTISINGGGCNVNTTTLSISQPPVLVTSLTTSSYTICRNDILTLNSITSGGTPSYSVNWNSGAINTNSIVVSPSLTTVYSYTVTDANNCSNTQTVQINVESATAGFNNSTSTCNSLISFTNTSIGANSINWNFGDAQSSSSNSVTTNNYLSSGNYTVTLIATTLNGCSDTLKKAVNVNVNYLSLDFDFFIKRIKCYDSVLFINKSVGATSYSWIFNNGSISNQNSPTQIFTPGFYQITLIGSNNSCTDTIEKQINILESNHITDENTPNVFTPNGDGVNDIFDFKVMSNCKDFTFEIMDRWGLSILKMSDKKQNFWDGRTTSGEEVSDGTYFYIMNIENGNKLKGTVTIFR